MGDNKFLHKWKQLQPKKELTVAVLAVISALATAVAGVLNKFRAYKIEKISDDKIIFKYIFPDVKKVIAKELNLNETR